MKIKESMGRYSKPIKNIISFVVFMVLLVMLFSKITYLFRNTGSDRLFMIGLQAEGNLDVIYVGGSSAFTYFQPLKAWNDCGFTSYNYATNSQQSDGPEFYIKEALKTHDPALFIVEMRDFISYDPSVYEPALRNGADSMNWWSVNRWKYIYSYLTYHPADEDTDVLSFYFDIAKYHTNLVNLSNQTAWEYSDNIERCAGKGFKWIDAYDRLSEPTDYMTDERVEIPQESEELLNRLLDYCDKQNLQVLFVVAPMKVSADQMGKYNTLKDMIETRGYKFLNANECYDEMSFDFSTDVYNENHVNCFGAEKYTQFLEEYLVNNYDLPDHRGDIAYSSWDEDFVQFSEEEVIYKYYITARQEDYGRSLEYEKEINNIINFAEWSGIVKDSRYYILSAQRGEDWTGLSIPDQLLLNSFGLHGTDLECSVFNSSVLESNTLTESFELSGTIGRGYNDAVSYYINNTDGKASITINGAECSRMDDGINVVVVDKILGRVVDSVTLYVNDEENICISR